MTEKNTAEDTTQETATARSPDSVNHQESEPPSQYSNWEAWIDTFRVRLGEQLSIWPDQVQEQLNLVNPAASTAVPTEGDVLLYIHGYLGEGRVDALNTSGANQAAALRQALTDEFADRRDPPTVVAGMWNSSASWPTATRRAINAGRTLADWLTASGDRYDRLILVGHSLGGRVALVALSCLEDSTVDSVGLLGAAMSSTAVRGPYRHGIETAVDGHVYNYHSVNDFVVCNLYNFREGHDGIGCTGTLLTRDASGARTPLPNNYVDVDVSETVHRHLDYFKPVSMTVAGNCLPQLVANQF